MYVHVHLCTNKDIHIYIVHVQPNVIHVHVHQCKIVSELRINLINSGLKTTELSWTGSNGLNSGVLLYFATLNDISLGLEG